MNKDTMYILGQICRAIWPGLDNKGRDQAPMTIVDIVLVKPATGLAMMLKHKGNAKEKQEEIMELVSRLGDIADPEGGVGIEDQGPFWLGYYHYSSAIDDARKYGPEQLELAGKTLFGDRWQTDLSNALRLSDPRRIRQWMAGERKIPVGVWADVCALLRQRQVSIRDLLHDMTGEK